VTEVNELSAIDLIRQDGPPKTVADLIGMLSAFPPTAVVVVSLDGPDPGVCSPLDWADVMGYWPDSPYHGNPINWDPIDDEDPDPDSVKAVVLGPRGLPDEARPPREGE
jgi:hypothetical protein